MQVGNYLLNEFRKAKETIKNELRELENKHLKMLYLLCTDE